MLKSCIAFMKEKKKFPSKDDRFAAVQQYLSSPIFLAVMEISLYLVFDFEPELPLFQTDQRMYSLMFSLMERFVCREFLQENTITTKLMKIDLTE